MNADSKSGFTEEELYSIKLATELHRGSEVDGVRFSGFETLSDLISEKIEIEEMSRERLLESYHQVKSHFEYLVSFSDEVDPKAVSIVSKFRTMVDNEIKRRQKLKNG